MYTLEAYLALLEEQLRTHGIDPDGRIGSRTHMELLRGALKDCSPVELTDRGLDLLVAKIAKIEGRLN